MKIQHINCTFNHLIKSDAGILFLGLIFTNFLYFILAVIFDSLFYKSGHYIFNKSIKIKDGQNIYKTTYQRDIQEDFHSKNNEKCIVEVSCIHKIFKKTKPTDNNDDNDRNISNGKEFMALDDVSFKVYQNEIFAILGINITKFIMNTMTS